MAFQTPRRERPDPAALDLRDGTVTRVAQQANDPERASVFLDGAFAFGLAVDLAVAEGLKPGLTLSAARQRALLEQQEGFAARARALGLVADRARTREEVRRKLAEAGFAESVTEDALAGLERAGLLDDAAYAAAYARGRFAGRGHGPARIRQDLLRRGVAREHIDAALGALADEEDVAARAHDDAAARWRALASEPDPRKRKKKVFDFLLRRGHDPGTARTAVERLATDDDEEEFEV